MTYPHRSPMEEESRKHYALLSKHLSGNIVPFELIAQIAQLEATYALIEEVKRMRETFVATL